MTGGGRLVDDDRECAEDIPDIAEIGGELDDGWR
jgi:hypothetical protein